MKKIKISKSLIATGVVCTLFGGGIAFAAGAALYNDNSATVDSLFQGLHAIGRELIGAKTAISTANSDKAKAEAEKATALSDKADYQSQLRTANSTIASLQAQVTTASSAAAAANTAASTGKSDAESKGAAVAAAKDKQINALKTEVDRILAATGVTPDPAKDKADQIRNGNGETGADAMNSADQDETRAVYNANH